MPSPVSTTASPGSAAASPHTPTGLPAAFPADAGGLSWETFEPAFPPRLFGRDTLIVLDRQDD